MTEDLRNKNGRMSTNPRGYCRIEYHQKLRKFQEGSGMFGRNYFARSLLDFWSSIPRNIRDFWSFSRKFVRISRLYQSPSISVIIHELTRNLREFGHYSISFLGFSTLATHRQGNMTEDTHTHTKADQRKRSNNYTKITQLIPSELFLCNLCV